MLIKQVHQESVVFVVISNLLGKGFKFQLYMCNRYHDMLMVSLKSNIITF